jgi:hypothetical protein
MKLSDTPYGVMLITFFMLLIIFSAGMHTRGCW